MEEIPGHEHCRIREFQRWHRIVLEHEREYLSCQLAQTGAFIDEREKNRVLHELTDIDYFLSQQPVKETP